MRRVQELQNVFSISRHRLAPDAPVRRPATFSTSPYGPNTITQGSTTVKILPGWAVSACSVSAGELHL